MAFGRNAAKTPKPLTEEASGVHHCLSGRVEPRARSPTRAFSLFSIGVSYSSVDLPASGFPACSDAELALPFRDISKSISLYKSVIQDPAKEHTYTKIIFVAQQDSRQLSEPDTVDGIVGARR